MQHSQHAMVINVGRLVVRRIPCGILERSRFTEGLDQEFSRRGPSQRVFTWFGLNCNQATGEARDV